MIKLYDTPFSPFTRKIKMVLDYKGLSYDVADVTNVHTSQGREFASLNSRVEVPVLKDNDILIVNSSDIVAYL